MRSGRRRRRRVSGIVKRRAVNITLTCFNSFHIFLVVAVSVFFPVDGILEHEHCRNTKVSQFSTLIITISLCIVEKYTPAKNACYYSGWNMFMV